MVKDIHGSAVLDFYEGNSEASLTLYNNYGEPEEMPVEVFFREEIDLSMLEQKALEACHGHILDLGAGAGAHTLILQERGFQVCALDNSPGCIEVMKRIGVQNVILDDYEKHSEQYDTVLVLMNGLGLAGKLAGVPGFLSRCMSMLKPGGRLLFDSSDIQYLYQNGLEKPPGYYGEVKYQYLYDGAKGSWFDWVYVDKDTLEEICDEMHLSLQILYTDENDQYLAKITKG